MNFTCFRFIADGRLKRKLRPMKKYPTFLQSKLFLSSAILENTGFFFCSFFQGGVKIQNKKSLLSTYKIFINSKCRLNKVRTNIVVDKKKKPNPIALADGVEVRNRLYLLLQEIDQERVQEPPGIKSHPAVPWFFASSPLVRRGTVYNTLRFRHQSIGLDQKKRSFIEVQRDIATILQFLTSQRSTVAASVARVIRPLFAKKIPNFQTLQIYNYSTIIPR